MAKARTQSKGARAAPGVAKAAKAFVKAAKGMTAEAAAKKAGVSPSYVRRLRYAAKARNFSKLAQGKRSRNFLDKHYKQLIEKPAPPPPQPPPGQDDWRWVSVSVGIASLRLANFLLARQPMARRSKAFFFEADAIQHAQTIVGASAVSFVYDSKDGSNAPWRYGVYTETADDTFIGALRAFFASIGIAYDE